MYVVKHSFFCKLNYRSEYHYIYSNSNINFLAIIKHLDHITTQKAEKLVIKTLIFAKSGTFNNLLGHFNYMGAVH
jgi:hypothetical protein